jgi:hypothetical protein
MPVVMEVAERQPLLESNIAARIIEREALIDQL